MTDRQTDIKEVTLSKRAMGFKDECAKTGEELYHFIGVKTHLPYM